MGNAARLALSNGRVSFGTPFHHLSVASTVHRGANCSVANRDRRRLHRTYGHLGIRASTAVNGNGLVSTVFNRCYRRRLIRPAFIASCPVRVSPLYGHRHSGPRLARHFRLFIGNGRLYGTCSRLGSPVSRLRHFRRRLRLDRGNSSRTVFVSVSFIHTLRCNVPSYSNVNVNVSHLAVFVASRTSVRSILFFPRVHPRGGTIDSPIRGCARVNIPRR